MTFATLIDGYALNASIRLTFSEPVRVTAGVFASGEEPTRVVFATGVSAGVSESSAGFSRTANAVPQTLAGYAEAPAVDAWRVMSVQVRGVGSTAIASGVSTRLAYMTPAGGVGRSSALTAMPLRQANVTTQPLPKDHTLNGMMIGEGGWHSGYSVGFAEGWIVSDVLPTRLVSVVGEWLAASAEVSSASGFVTRWMTPRVSRNRAICYAKEGLVFKLKVFQQYAGGTAIVRAQSRGTPNTILAFSITYAQADVSLPQSAVKVAREAVPSKAISECLATGVTDQRYSVEGRSVCMASAVISPDVYVALDATKYVYAQSAKVATASLSKAVAVRWPMVVGVRLPAWCDISFEQFIARDATGVCEVIGASASQPTNVEITHAVWVNLLFEASAVSSLEYTALRKVDSRSVLSAYSTGVPWHWVAVSADGTANALASAWGENPRIYTDGAGAAFAEIDSTLLGRKIAYVSGRAEMLGASLGEAANVTRHMRSDQLVCEATAEAFYPTQTHTTTSVLVEGVAISTASFHNAGVAATPAAATCVLGLTLPWAEETGVVGARHFRSVYSTSDTAAQAAVTLPWADGGNEVGARRFSWVFVDSVEPAIAEGGASRNVFKVNAGAYAPIRRSIILNYDDRRLFLADAPREYRVL